ncbi:MAG: type ISP restriction/modification enzyme [Bacteroidota bacterium]|nr:type ISP restriction/modification enzyme [Bacteroidota bacterium]
MTKNTTLNHFEKYFKSLRSFKISEITEHSHRKDLQELLELYVGPKMKILHEPKRDGKLGSPDFKIIQTESIVGYVENKKIEEILEKVLKSDQLKKYQQLSDNILLTNYIDWIWIREGKVVQTVEFCSLDDIKNKKATLDPQKARALEKLLTYFFSQAPKKIGDVKKLAKALAIRAKYLKDFLLVELQHQEKEHTEGRLYQLYETFKTHVFHELSVAEFADAFAQNLVYGLFLAKLNADTQLVNLYNAKKFIPSSFELIKELVNFLDELDNDEYRETRWIVEEVLTIMNNLDLPAIHESLSFTKKRKDKNDLLVKDPYVYFYEDFLAEYDKKLRESKGVYYTPPPVVNFIVRAIDDILVNTFNIKEGLADRNKVTVLDFATGTGTFLVEMLQQIFDKLPKDSGKKDILIKEHILKNFYGFEFLIAPYTIAHLKLSQFLKDNGYELKPKERLQIYLTNTLEPIGEQIKIPMLPALTDEAKQAQHVKEKPILVITGNPPYSGHSKNPSEIKVKLPKGTKYFSHLKWNESFKRFDEVFKVTKKEMVVKQKTFIGKKILEYFFVDGKPLKEKNPKWLQDDYVKFIRFAQDKMDSVEEGVVGIITNHSFLDNPTFRGMRKSLIDSFDQLYFINLRGNTNKKEKNPSGGKDENVFDIVQGVSISLFIKKKGLKKKISYTDFWGTRKEKYQTCLRENVHGIEWKDITPSKPYYFFWNYNPDLSAQYNAYQSLTQIFQKYSVGPNSHRDSFAIAFSHEEALSRIKDLLNKQLSDKEIASKYNIPDTRDWKLPTARKEKFDKQNILKCLYRPFDFRYMLYGKFAFDYHRPEINENLKKGVRAIITTRQTKEPFGALICNIPVGQHKLSTAYDGSYIFPLTISDENITNYSQNYIDYFKNIYGIVLSIDKTMNYIYSILYSPTYRKKYAEFLKVDYPRIPFTEDIKLFKQIAKLGSELIDVHLLEKHPRYPNGHFIGKGNNVVEKPHFVLDKKKGKLYINSTQYFDNVPQEVYEFCIGGYQVLDKYLKDRKGRELGSDEIDNVESIVKSLIFTINQMEKIDALTKNWI